MSGDYTPEQVADQVVTLMLTTPELTLTEVAAFVVSSGASPLTVMVELAALATAGVKLHAEANGVDPQTFWRARMAEAALS